jgi:hypothetical protein
MNERIKQLAASHFPRDGEGNISATPEMIIEFAKVIVAECAGVELYWLNEQDRKAVAEKIKQHFGVEE